MGTYLARVGAAGDTNMFVNCKPVFDKAYVKVTARQIILSTHLRKM